MSEKLTSSLKQIFDAKRVVFWYDPDGAMRSEYDAVTIADVEKIELKDNPFGVKYRILREKPTTKFLVYSPAVRPAPADNWLYDLELAGAIFNTDERSMLLAELGLGEVFRALVGDTMPFFRKSSRRLVALKALIEPQEETVQSLSVKMIGICCDLKGVVKFEHVLWKLLGDEASESETHLTVLKNCGLLPSLWRQMRLDYGYVANEPGIWDFACKLFHDAYFPQLSADASAKLSPSALAFFNDWKENLRNCDAFEKLSDRAVVATGAWTDISTREIKEFRSLDTFCEIDRRIIKQLASEIEAGTRRADEVQVIVTERQNGHWSARYEKYYQALNAAASFIQRLSLADFSCTDVPDGIAKYAANWHVFDRDYRLFTEKAADLPQLVDLKKRLDGLYVNGYLMPQAKSFQKCVDAADGWKFAGPVMQKDFWSRVVEPEKDNKLCVVVSDAFRYEVAGELVDKLLATNKYGAELKPMIGVLPSYTQLGKAALLPHGELTFDTEPVYGKLTKCVRSDGDLTAGCAARGEILQTKRGATGVLAMKADDLLALPLAEVRNLTHDSRLLYVYHDKIDAIGHKRVTENMAFKACRDAIEDVAKIIQRIAGEGYISKFVITADHGFLYQDMDVEESDVIRPALAISSSDANDRRCLIGRALDRGASELRYFTAAQLGLGGEAEVAIAKGVTRMPQEGACKRFTHGGASLQEIVLPLVNVVYRRKGKKTTQVEVDILGDDSGRITTGQLVVRLFQRDAVAGKITPRTVRVGLYTADGSTLLSDRKEIVVNSPSDLVADRTIPVTLTLNHVADGLGRVNVLLKVENRLPKETVEEFENYKDRTYSLCRAMSSDFDF